MAQAESVPTAAYVSWGTFKNQLEKLSQGIPNKVTKGYFVGLNASVVTQLLHAMRFFGLITDEGKPTALNAVAIPDEAERKKQFEKVFRARYSAMFEIDLEKTTIDELGDRLAEAYSVSGSTKVKAVRFFLAAVSYLGIPMSPHVVKAAAKISNPAPRRRIQKQKDTPPPPPARPGTPEMSGATSKSIDLPSGGSLTLTAVIDPFSQSKDERDFMYSLRDQMDEFAKKFKVDEQEDAE